MLMETYSYADSVESSPRSRDVDFDIHHQPWDDHHHHHHQTKVKFMCSYGGKIHPRPHDSHLSYVGGETKILAVDRFVKFDAVMAKLTALCDGGDVSTFKYQLPGEDLDALISVTNDDDLEHMMHEYDRLSRASSTPAKLRLFLFPVSGQSPALTPVHSFGSTEGRSERERFVDRLNRGHHQQHHHLQSATTPPSAAAHGDTEVMFGLDKSGLMPPMPSGLISKTPDHQICDPQGAVVDERGIEADNRIQKHIQDLQKLEINADQEQQQPVLYRKPSDDNLAAAAGYTNVVPRIITTTDPATGYQISPDQQPPVYMIQTPASSMYMPRAVTAPVVNQGQGYYVQRMPTDQVNYRDLQPVYNVMPPVAQPPLVAQPPPVAVAVATQQTTVSTTQQPQFRQQNVATYTTEGYRVVQSGADAQAMAYDNATGGRQIYYTNHGAVVAAQPQLHPMQQHYQAAAMTLNQENAGNVVPANINELI